MDMPELQNQIDNARKLFGVTETTSIQLTKWSEVSDLTSNVDVDVVIEEGKQRIFSIVTYRFLDRLFLNESDRQKVLGDDAHFFTSGGPLVVAKEISGEIIVRGILKYVKMERAQER